MSEIRIKKIDGQEFVPYNDYKELKELYKNLIERLEEENEKLEKNRSIEIKTCNRYRERCEKYSKEISQLKIDLSNAEMSTRCWGKVAKWIDNQTFKS